MSVSIQYHFFIQVCLLLTSSLCFTTKAQDQNYCPPCDNSNFTYLCRSLPTLGAKIRLCYYKNNTTPNNATLDVVFSVKQPLSNGWVAWGLNPERAQMVNSQVLIARPNSNKTFNVLQGVLTYDTKHGCGVSQTGFEVKVYRKSANYSESSGMMILYAKLGLPDWCNYTKFSHVWQVGPGINRDGSLVGHARMLQNFDSRETIDLTNGHVLWHNHRTLRKAHGILSIVGWGFLLPCGVITSRYFRVYPLPCIFWFAIHIGFNICAYIIGTVGWSIGLSLKADHFRTFKAHRIIGIIIFGLATLQMLAIFLKPKIVDKYRHYWNIYHHFVGYTIVSFAVINIFKGFAILQPPKSLKHTYIGLLLFLASVFFLLEVYTWVKFYLDRTKNPSPQKNEDVAESQGAPPTNNPPPSKNEHVAASQGAPPTNNPPPPKNEHVAASQGAPPTDYPPPPKIEHVAASQGAPPTDYPPPPKIEHVAASQGAPPTDYPPTPKIEHVAASQGAPPTDIPPPPKMKM